MKIIAHRGMHSSAIRENSQEAIAKCVGSVADGIEIDVRITADNICVVHHDTRLENGARLSRVTFDELVALDPQLITVTNALELLRPFTGLINLEVKHLLGERDRFRGLACVEQLSSDVTTAYAGEDASRVLISSFSLPNMREMAVRLPDISRAYLAPRALSFARMLARATRYRCTAIHVAVAQMKARRFAEFVRTAHAQGLEVRVFIVNSERNFDIARACGVDAIFTDVVDEMHKLRS